MSPSTEPHAVPNLVSMVILGTDLFKFLQYLLLPIREMVSHYRIGSRDSEFEYPIPLP